MPKATTSGHSRSSVRPGSSTPACQRSGTAACPARLPPGPRSATAAWQLRNRAAPASRCAQSRRPARNATRPDPLPKATGEPLSRPGRQHQPATRDTPPLPRRRRTGRRPRTSRPPRRHANPGRRAAQAATGDPDAKTDLPGNDHPPRPSPEPRSEPEAPSPLRQAGHQARAGVAADTGTGGKPDPDRRDAAPSADWRDEILGAAREPWQPGPSWPDNPALRRPPEADTPGAGIEPGEPDI